MAEQDFLNAFRAENVIDSVKLMEIWEKTDKDGNGLIDLGELKNLLKSLGVADDKLSETSEKLMAMYDKNNDGKLGLTELGNLLQNGQNILQAFVDGEELTREKFDEIFKRYDRDGNGTIQGNELLGFLKDMKATQDQDVECQSLIDYKRWIMQEADKNGDGKLGKNELAILFFGE